ncbi:MAG: hypothetical protein O2779_01795 [Nanoarchaeota archaeon]|nr:hypothetical protein [Nanoarchaeota archaeon]
MNGKVVFSFLLPIISIAFVFGFLYATEPTITGFAVVNESGALRNLDARVTLSTSSGEVIPENAYVAVTIDRKQAFMTVRDFILKSGQEYNYTSGELESVSYTGLGFSGDYVYELWLSDFSLDRRVLSGVHTVKMEILYLQHTLLEKSEEVIVS